MSDERYSMKDEAQKYLEETFRGFRGWLRKLYLDLFYPGGYEGYVRRINLQATGYDELMKVGNGQSDPANISVAGRILGFLKGRGFGAREWVRDTIVHYYALRGVKDPDGLRAELTAATGEPYEELPSTIEIARKINSSMSSGGTRVVIVLPFESKLTELTISYFPLKTCPFRIEYA
jgi:hypothetical protein